MSRKSRFSYKSKRERLQRDLSTMRLVSIFAGIGTIIWLIMKRQEVGWWLESLWYKIF